MSTALRAACGVLTSSRRIRYSGISSALFLMVACAPPAAKPLGGVLAPMVALPSSELAPGYRQVVFDWEFEQGDARMRGEGVVRIAPPDSARLDLFLAGGYGGGGAVLIGDDLRAPLVESARRLIPPAPMLWAAFGRLAIPAAADTTVRVDGSTVRADIGAAPVWRVEFHGPRLARLDRIDDGRVRDFLNRRERVVIYESFSPRSKLTLRITRDEPAMGFDANIWTL
ncbi:MAG: hypothetical protein ACSLFE_02190 [Gemmatimonadaceae bacterium]